MSATLQATMLRPLYDQALREWPLLGTPVAVAARFEGPDPTEAADRIAAFYLPLCGTTGFLCGLPGLLALPLTLPLNLAGVAALQLHMCAALATTAGLDCRDEAVRDAAIRCVLIDASDARGREELLGAVRRVATKTAERSARLLTEKTLQLLARQAPRRLPFAGGVLSAVGDAAHTRRVARAARAVFLDPVAGPAE